MLAQVALVFLARLARARILAFPPSVSPQSPQAAALDTLVTMTQDDGVSMKWTGSIFAGEEPIVLYGTASDIYNAIIAVNPNFEPADVPSEVRANASFDILTKRQSDNPVTCSVMATGTHAEIRSARAHLRLIGGTCGTPRRECRRTTCEVTTGTYLCSELNIDVGIPCGQINYYLEEIDACCVGGPAISGHQYSPNRYWSVWAGFGHCGHPPNERPSIYPYLPHGGPNGFCRGGW